MNIFQPPKATFSGAHTLRTTSSWAAGTSRLVVYRSMLMGSNVPETVRIPKRTGHHSIIKYSSLQYVIDCFRYSIHPRYDALISYKTNLHQSKRCRMITVWFLVTSLIVESFWYPYVPCTEPTIKMSMFPFSETPSFSRSIPRTQKTHRISKN